MAGEVRGDCASPSLLPREPRRPLTPAGRPAGLVLDLPAAAKPVDVSARYKEAGHRIIAGARLTLAAAAAAARRGGDVGGADIGVGGGGVVLEAIHF